MQQNTITILAVSGSLRPGSSNHFILQFMGSLLPQCTVFSIYEGIDEIPHFNPALDLEPSPDAVERWRNAIHEADGVIICTPEYAFGVPGSLKNALDWTVASGSLNQKPVALVTASSTGEKAHAALLNIFTALGARVAKNAKLLIPFVRTKVNGAGAVTDEATRIALNEVTQALLREVDNFRAERATIL